MNIYKVLSTIIWNKAHLNNYISSKKQFYITERDKSAKCKKVYLCNLDEKKLFAFKLDIKNKKKISNYFENGMNLDKGNDAIIFTEIDNQKYIFICELKDGGKNFINQFKSSKSFVEYLLAILRNFYNIKIELKDFKIIFILFSKGVNMSTTKGKYIPIKKDNLLIYKVPCTKSYFYIQSFI